MKGGREPAWSGAMTVRLGDVRVVATTRMSLDLARVDLLYGNADSVTCWHRHKTTMLQ